MTHMSSFQAFLGIARSDVWATWTPVAIYSAHGLVSWHCQWSSLAGGPLLLGV